MATNRQYSPALLKAQMDALTTHITNAALLRIYDGAQPADPTVAVGAQNKLAEFTCGTPFAGAGTSARPSVITMTDPANVNGLFAGTTQPTWFRIVHAADSAGTTGEIDGNVAATGTAGVTADMICGPITLGQPVDITGWTITSSST
jgi:hypothetical protein